MRYGAAMGRTFVHVELEYEEARADFSHEMAELGFVQTVLGRKDKQPLRVPIGMYFIEGPDPVDVLAMTREAGRRADVRIRIFCVPAGGDVRFGNLQQAAT
jgi:hypothetical protein